MEVPNTSQAANQLWVYENGYIKNRKSGNVVDVRGASRQKGVEAIVYHAKGAPNQLWDFTADGYIISRDSGHVLDIPGGTAHENVRLQVYDRKPNAPHQQWVWDEMGFISSKANPGLVLDSAQGSDHLVLYHKKQI